MMCQCIF